MAMETRNKIFLVLLLLLFWYTRISWSLPQQPQPQPQQSSRFPVVDLSIMNNSGKDVYLMCDFPGYDKFFHQVKDKEKIQWELELMFFPTKWCYLYYNDRKHGFFWLYTVRLKCLKCEWSIRERPYVYRVDRERWESSDIYTIPDVADAMAKST